MSDRHKPPGDRAKPGKAREGKAAEVVAFAPGETVRPYNLFLQDRVTRARMPTLDVINDRFSRFFRAALFQHLRKAVELTAGPVEVIKHSQLLERFTVPSYLVVVSLKPLRGTMLLVMDEPLVVSTVESRFGGNGRFPVSMGQREFTPVEQKVMRRVADAALEQFVLAWEPVGRFEPEVMRCEFNPQFASVATSSEVVIVSTFHIKIDNGSGKLVTCIPYTSLEPMRDQLMSGVVSDSVDTDGRWHDLLKDGVERAVMPLRVELAEIEMTVRDLLELRPGDVFEIDRPETVVIEANGLPLFRGRWGRHGRRSAVRIDEYLASLPEVLTSKWPERRGDDGGRKE